MIGKTLTMAAFALTAMTAPALAQTTAPGAPPATNTPPSPTSGDAMQSQTMPGTTPPMTTTAPTDGTMAPPAPGTPHSMAPMSDRDMATMKKCEAMPADRMAKDKKCAKLMEMHSGTASPATTPTPM